MTPAVASRLGLSVTSPEINANPFQVASPQTIQMIGACQDVPLLMVPSEGSSARSVVATFELLLLACDSHSILLGLPTL
jgi:hypothetical protein